MNKYDLTHLTDDEVLGGLAALARKERASKSKLRKALAEMDRRGLEVPSSLAVQREDLAD